MTGWLGANALFDGIGTVGHVPRRPGAKTFARQLGARIRALRAEAAITQERLAWDSDLDKGYVSQMEAGLRLPSLPVLVALARTLGVTIADVVAFDVRSPRLRVLDAMRRGDAGDIELALAAWRRTRAKARAT